MSIFYWIDFNQLCTFNWNNKYVRTFAFIRSVLDLFFFYIQWQYCFKCAFSLYLFIILCYDYFFHVECLTVRCSGFDILKKWEKKTHTHKQQQSMIEMCLEKARKDRDAEFGHFLMPITFCAYFACVQPIKTNKHLFIWFYFSSIIFVHRMCLMCRHSD